MPEHQTLWLKSYAYAHNVQRSRLVEEAMDAFIQKTEHDEEMHRMKMEEIEEDAKRDEYERKKQEALDNEDEHMNWGRI